MLFVIMHFTWGGYENIWLPWLHPEFTKEAFLWLFFQSEHLKYTAWLKMIYNYIVGAVPLWENDSAEKNYIW